MFLPEAKASSDTGSVVSDFKVLRTAIVAFEWDHGRPITQTDGMSALVAGGFWTGTDPWGNEYHLLFSDEHPGDLIGIYSTGPDGVSASKGNDPDDLSSWRDHSLPSDVVVAPGLPTIGIGLLVVVGLIILALMVAKKGHLQPGEEEISEQGAGGND